MPLSSRVSKRNNTVQRYPPRSASPSSLISLSSSAEVLGNSQALLKARVFPLHLLMKHKKASSPPDDCQLIKKKAKKKNKSVAMGATVDDHDEQPPITTTTAASCGGGGSVHDDVRDDADDIGDISHISSRRSSSLPEEEGEGYSPQDPDLEDISSKRNKETLRNPPNTTEQKGDAKKEEEVEKGRTTEKETGGETFTHFERRQLALLLQKREEMLCCLVSVVEKQMTLEKMRQDDHRQIASSPVLKTTTTSSSPLGKGKGAVVRGSRSGGGRPPPAAAFSSSSTTVPLRPKLAIYKRLPMPVRKSLLLSTTQASSSPASPSMSSSSSTLVKSTGCLLSRPGTRSSSRNYGEGGRRGRHDDGDAGEEDIIDGAGRLNYNNANSKRSHHSQSLLLLPSHYTGKKQKDHSLLSQQEFELKKSLILNASPYATFTGFISSQTTPTSAFNTLPPADKSADRAWKASFATLIAKKEMVIGKDDDEDGNDEDREDVDAIIRSRERANELLLHGESGRVLSRREEDRLGRGYERRVEALLVSAGKEDEEDDEGEEVVTSHMHASSCGTQAPQPLTQQQQPQNDSRPISSMSTQQQKQSGVSAASSFRSSSVIFCTELNALIQSIRMVTLEFAALYVSAVQDHAIDNDGEDNNDTNKPMMMMKRRKRRKKSDDVEGDVKNNNDEEGVEGGLLHDEAADDEEERYGILLREEWTHDVHDVIAKSPEVLRVVGFPVYGNLFLNSRFMFPSPSPDNDCANRGDQQLVVKEEGVQEERSLQQERAQECKLLEAIFSV